MAGGGGAGAVGEQSALAGWAGPGPDLAKTTCRRVASWEPLCQDCDAAVGALSDATVGPLFICLDRITMAIVAFKSSPIKAVHKSSPCNHGYRGVQTNN